MELVILGKLLVMAGMGGLFGNQVGKGNFIGGFSVGVATVGFWLIFFFN